MMFTLYVVVIDKVSSNLVNTFIYSRQILLIKYYEQGQILFLELFYIVILNGFCTCIDSALMGR